MKSPDELGKGLPKLDVSSFRQDLRSRLLETAQRLPSQRPLKIGLACSAGLSLVLALLLGLMVIEPSYATRMHRAFWDGEQTAPTLVRVQAPEIDDRDLVHRWALEEYPSEALQVVPVQHAETIRVSRFQLNNGKQVQVYTRLPGADQKPETFNNNLIRRVSY